MDFKWRSVGGGIFDVKSPETGYDFIDRTDVNNPRINHDNDKVDVVAGKQLSTEDYTTADKDKLAGIEDGATVAKNAKLTINQAGIKIAEFTADADTDVVCNLSDDTWVQSDWSTTESTEPSFIKSKPTNLSDFTNDEHFISNIATDTTTDIKFGFPSENTTMELDSLANFVKISASNMGTFTMDNDIIALTSTLSGTGTSTMNMETGNFTWSAFSGDFTSLNVLKLTPTEFTLNDVKVVTDGAYVHTDYNFDSGSKGKLDGIETGAEVNVQSDWGQTDSSKDSFIANKPTDLVHDANYVHTDNNYTNTDQAWVSSQQASKWVEDVNSDNTAIKALKGNAYWLISDSELDLYNQTADGKSSSMVKVADDYTGIAAINTNAEVNSSVNIGPSSVKVLSLNTQTSDAGTVELTTSAFTYNSKQILVTDDIVDKANKAIITDINPTLKSDLSDVYSHLDTAKQDVLTAGDRIIIDSTTLPGTVTIKTEEPVAPSDQLAAGKIADAKEVALALANVARSTHSRGSVVSAYTKKKVYSATTITLNTAGTGYTAKDSLQYGLNMKDVLIVIETVDANGEILTFTISATGANDVDPGALTSQLFVGGTGSGATFDLSFTEIDGSVLADIPTPTENDEVIVLKDELHNDTAWLWVYADTNGDGVSNWISISPSGGSRNFIVDPIIDAELATNAVKTANIVDANVTLGKLESDIQTKLGYVDVTSSIATSLGDKVSKSGEKSKLYGTDALTGADTMYDYSGLQTTANKVSTIDLDPSTASDLKYPTEYATATALATKEDKANKVTGWSSTTTNTNYPSEKLVKDSLDLKVDETEMADKVDRKSAKGGNPDQQAEIANRDGEAIIDVSVPDTTDTDHEYVSRISLDPNTIDINSYEEGGALPVKNTRVAVNTSGITGVVADDTNTNTLIFNADTTNSPLTINNRPVPVYQQISEDDYQAAKAAGTLVAGVIYIRYYVLSGTTQTLTSIWTGTEEAEIDQSKLFRDQITAGTQTSIYRKQDDGGFDIAAADANNIQGRTDEYLHTQYWEVKSTNGTAYTYFDIKLERTTGLTIDVNTSDGTNKGHLTIDTNGVIQYNNKNIVRQWVGTKAQLTALGTYEDGIIYVVTDENL
jgi:hypothetical protein